MGIAKHTKKFKVALTEAQLPKLQLNHSVQAPLPPPTTAVWINTCTVENKC